MVVIVRRCIHRYIDERNHHSALPHETSFVGAPLPSGWFEAGGEVWNGFITCILVISGSYGSTSARPLHFSPKNRYIWRVSKTNMTTTDSRNITYYILYAISFWLGSFLLFGLLNVNNFITILRDTSSLPEYYLTDSVDSVFLFVTEWLDRLPFIRTTVTFLFWLLVGFVVYGIVVTVGGFFATLGQERSLFRDYRHPLFEKRDSLVRTILIHWMLVIGLGLVWLFVVAGLAISLPITRELFINGFRSPNEAGAWAFTIGSTTVFSALAMAVVWLTKLLRRAKQTLSDVS